jgi:hypothetical protein
MTTMKTMPTIKSELNPDEMVFYNEGGKIMSGGYSINSMFLNDGLSPMRTMNSLESTQAGGGDKSKDKVSSIFDNLAVPAGLFLINNQRSSLTSVGDYMNSEMLPDNIFDEFMKAIDMNKNTSKKNDISKEDTNKKGKKNTKKHKIMLTPSPSPTINVKATNKKTRKQTK